MPPVRLVGRVSLDSQDNPGSPVNLDDHVFPECTLVPMVRLHQGAGPLTRVQEPPIQAEAVLPELLELLVAWDSRVNLDSRVSPGGLVRLGSARNLEVARSEVPTKARATRGSPASPGCLASPVCLDYLQRGHQKANQVPAVFPKPA